MQTAGPQTKNPGSRIGKIKEKIKKIPIHVWLLSALSIIIIIALVLIFPSFFSKLGEKLLRPFPSRQKANVAVPAKASPIPLAHGKQIYNISGGTKGGPQMTQAIINPIDPSPAQFQTLTIKANNLKPITEIKATLITDNKETTHSLELIKGTNVDGVWQGSWRIEDDYNFNYQIALKAKNNENIESKVTLTFR